MPTYQLPEGAHTIKWAKEGYVNLIATISISSTGTISCISVSGGTCGAGDPPNVTISGSTVTGYLQVSLTPVTEICSYIDSKGGAAGISIPEIFELVDAYLNFVNIGFTPTIQEIIGTEDYYLGFISSGNTKTGCTY